MAKRVWNTVHENMRFREEMARLQRQVAELKAFS